MNNDRDVLCNKYKQTIYIFFELFGRKKNSNYSQLVVKIIIRLKLIELF